MTRVGDNAYKLDFPGEYGISTTFNVADLSAFDFDSGPDSRMTPFQGGGNDEVIQGQGQRQSAVTEDHKFVEPKIINKGPI